MYKNSILLLAFLLAGCSQLRKADVTRFVDPQIGSVHGRWFFYTPAAVPFGMAKLAPQTNAYGGIGGWAPQGYDDRHSSIEGFGHFHEFQIGGVVVMPAVGELKTTPGTLDDPDAGYRSRFDKADEQAEPGYYSVLLKDYNIRAELTATERVGFHRYTFPKSDQARLIFDVGHKQGESGQVTDAYVAFVNDRQVEGFVETYPEYAKFCDPGKHVKMYFVARLDTPPDAVGTFIDDQPGRGDKVNGVGSGIYLTFHTTEQHVIEVQVGLSYTSIDNARLNLQTEAKDMTFDKVRARAKRIWNEKLGRIQVKGGQPQDKVKFYTGLYHALLGRGLASDVNGMYPKHDGTAGQIPLDQHGRPIHAHYNTDGIWGGFWNLGPLWALAYPEYLSDYIQSNIDFYQETGWLHDGEAAGVFTNGVQTNFQGLFMAAAYNCGIRDFDVATGYQAVRKNELDYHGRNLGNGKYDLSYFVKSGYVCYKDTTISNGWVFNFGASHTLEYAFSSFAVAQMAKSLGHQADYDKLMQQSGYWKNLFDPQTKFIRPKMPDGSFLQKFDPMKAWDGFQEGNAFQFTWYVPHDVAGLIKAVGPELFNQRLQKMFVDAQKSAFGGGQDIDSFSGVEKLYNHGNQPCLHDAWLFNYSGMPWLTQKWTRAICNEFYGTEPLHGYGYGQDEDQGQLGAWYVLAAMGLFDVQGHAAANPSFQFGSPLFDEISITLNRRYYAGKKLIIKTLNNSPENVYIQSARCNGENVENCWMDRARLMQGGTLTFEMGPTPNEAWGVGEAPPSLD